jgi:hypothetical protein
MEKYNTYISVVDKNNKIIYIKVDDIVKSPILSRILGLNDEFNDNPNKDEKGNYLYFNSLSSKSILLIFKCINKTKDEILNDMSIVNFIFKMGRENFNEACLFADYHCIDISYDLFSIIYEKEPINKEEDIYNQYQYFKFVIDDSNEKDLHHRLLSTRYLERNWVIVNQRVVKYTNNDIPEKYELTLRKSNFVNNNFF